mmetsp:Transcript_224/g.283  ORF Transcript_224/g.283 Transcript_224/m.283 type:complete len:152 (+) Transcript_224:69-524(+)
MQGCGGEMYLHLEFASFEYPVIFNQAPPPPQPPVLSINEPTLINDVHDEQNPVEMKYLKLAHRSSIYDKDLKPDQSERIQIDVKEQWYKTMATNKVNRKLFPIRPIKLSQLWRRSLFGNSVTSWRRIQNRYRSFCSALIGRIHRMWCKVLK